MRMAAWFRGLHIRYRHNARLRREVLDAREKADRLEIAVRRQQLRLDELSGDLVRLSERLSKTEGRALGGRPRRPAVQDELPLDEIPRGDKKALRRALGVGVVPIRKPDQE